MSLERKSDHINTCNTQLIAAITRKSNTTSEIRVRIIGWKISFR